MLRNNTCFYILSTPIGNLRDMSLKTIGVLYHIDIIFVENKANVLKILRYIGLNSNSKVIVSIRNIDKIRILEKIQKYLIQGFNVVLCSDAGMPVINDPGNYLINSLRLRSRSLFNVIQGSSSLIMGIVTSGLICNRFVFMGFLPINKKKRQSLIKNAFQDGFTLVVYESPVRVNAILGEIYIYYGYSRFAIARELTKIYETLHYGILNKFVYPCLFYKGEVVLIIEHPNIVKKVYAIV